MRQHIELRGQGLPEVRTRRRGDILAQVGNKADCETSVSEGHVESPQTVNRKTLDLRSLGPAEWQAKSGCREKCLKRRPGQAAGFCQDGHKTRTKSTQRDFACHKEGPKEV